MPTKGMSNECRFQAIGLNRSVLIKVKMNIRMGRNISSALMLTILLLNWAVSSPAVQIPNRVSIKSNELESLFDPIFAAHMAKSHIPGAVVAVVRDGKVLFTKGYGYSDIEKKTTVVPDKTLFRIGSITKVFTATA